MRRDDRLDGGSLEREERHEEVHGADRLVRVRAVLAPAVEPPLEDEVAQRALQGREPS